GIIHYGGHGDDDISPQGRPDDSVGVWASDIDGGSTLRWSKIQPTLGTADADILLILDCCYAAQAARGAGERVVPRNVEFLAACPKGRQTPGPMTPQSFTLALINEMNEELSRLGEKDTFTVNEVVHRLTSKKAGLKESPVYLPKYQDMIRLRPLHSNATTTTRRTQEDLPSITFKMMFWDGISGNLVDDIVSWLKRNPPPQIAGMTIEKFTDQTIEIQKFVLESTRSTGPSAPISIGKLPAASQSEVQNAWSTFISRLASSLGFFAGVQDGQQEPMNKTRFIKDLEDNQNSLRRFLERVILSSPRLFERETLEQGLYQPRSQILGLVDAIRVRLANIRPEPDKRLIPRMLVTHPRVVSSVEAPGSLSVEEHSEWPNTQVLVEWRLSESHKSEGHDIRCLRRLSDALKAAEAGHFRTPKCLGYRMLQASSNAKYGLFFQAPQKNSDPVTLYTLLQSQQSRSENRVAIPTLDERMRLAFEVAQALMRWHLAGWLHQGIASFHVVFFKTSPTTVEYNKPYLVGFGYARENNSSSIARLASDVTTETMRDLYRHPDRQGPRPPMKHQRKHDLYALGLMLIEIGRWTRLEGVFPKIIKNKRPTSSIPEDARKLTTQV
ncbi:hypothetical protein FDECE_17801, partial [Fusarium decemcellulare]